MPLLDEDFVGPDGPEDEPVSAEENDDSAQVFPDVVCIMMYDSLIRALYSLYSRTPPNEHSGQANTPLEWTILAGPTQFLLYNTI